MQYIMCGLDGKVVPPGNPRKMTAERAKIENRDIHTMGYPFVYIEQGRIEDGRVVRDPEGRKPCDICNRPTKSKTTCGECSRLLIMNSVPEDDE